MLGSIIYSIYSSETHGQRVRSLYRHVQTHIQHTKSRTHSVATRIVHRAAHAAHAAPAAPGDHARAAEPCRALAVHIVEIPQPATQGHARPSPRRSTVDGRPPQAVPPWQGHSARLRWRRAAWAAAATRGPASVGVGTHFVSAEGRAQRAGLAGRRRESTRERATRRRNATRDASPKARKGLGWRASHWAYLLLITDEEEDKRSRRGRQKVKSPDPILADVKVRVRGDVNLPPTIARDRRN